MYKYSTDLNDIWFSYGACLHGGGGLQTDVAGHTRKRDQTKIRDFMDRRVTPPKRVTSPTGGPWHLHVNRP